MKVEFRGNLYKIIITDHAEERMRLRNVTKDDVIVVLEKGKALSKDKKNAFWVYHSFKNRRDNLICLSISLETPHLIVITALVNWRPL